MTASWGDKLTISFLQPCKSHLCLGPRPLLGSTMPLLKGHYGPVLAWPFPAAHQAHPGAVPPIQRHSTQQGRSGHIAEC